MERQCRTEGGCAGDAGPGKDLWHVLHDLEDSRRPAPPLELNAPRLCVLIPGDETRRDERGLERGEREERREEII